MKLSVSPTSLKTLTQHLSKNLLPIYVIAGDEPLLTAEVLSLIREAALQAGFSERVRISIDSADWGKLLYEQAQSLSLFSTKQLLELDLTTAKMNAVNSKILQEYAAAPSKEIILLIRANKLDSKTEQSSWFKALAKVSGIIPIWPVAIEQLPTWILERAKKLNLTLTYGAAEYLATQVEGNLLAAAQELEKLNLLYLTPVTIDEKIIENTVTDNAHFDIFGLVDSALAGNLKRSLRILNNLAAENSEPTLILWALTRELRTMSELAKKIQQGVTLASLFSTYRIWEKRQSCVRLFLKRHQQKACWNLLAEGAAIDRIIKGAAPGNSWDTFNQWILKICS